MLAVDYHWVVLSPSPIHPPPAPIFSQAPTIQASLCSSRALCSLLPQGLCTCYSPARKTPPCPLTLINSSFSTLLPAVSLAFNTGSRTQRALQKCMRLDENRGGPDCPSPPPHAVILGKLRPGKGQQQQSPLISRRAPGCRRIG